MCRWRRAARAEQEGGGGGGEGGTGAGQGVAYVCIGVKVDLPPGHAYVAQLGIADVGVARPPRAVAADAATAGACDERAVGDAEHLVVVAALPLADAVGDVDAVLVAAVDEHEIARDVEPDLQSRPEAYQPCQVRHTQQELNQRRAVVHGVTSIC